MEMRYFFEELVNRSCNVDLRLVHRRLRFKSALQLPDRIESIADLARFLLRSFPATSFGADQFVFSVPIDVQLLHAIASSPV
jgi:hypothetical protein